MGKRFIRAGILSVIITLVMASIFAVLTFAPSIADDADLSYRTLDYDVNVTTSGDLEVTQHIDVKLKQREDGDGNVKPWKQLYQQYRLRADNLTDITDISVTNVTSETDYAQQSEPQSPSDVSDAAWDSDYANRWYIADVTAGDYAPKPYHPGEDGFAPADTADSVKTVEIGWNIPATDEADSMKFDVRFTMHDVATQWDDVAAFQWEPFGRSNPVPIGTVSGTVHFPAGVGVNDSWAWLHTERTSETARAADGGLTFKAYNIKSGDYLDLVAAYAVSPNGNSGIDRTRAGDHLDALKRSEAEQERQWRESQRNAACARLIFWIATVVLGVALCAWGLYASITSNRRAKYRGELEYWRDQPGISPAAAAKLVDVVEPSKTSLSNRQLTATLLALAVKKAIAIYPGPADMYRGIDMSTATPLALSHMIDGDPGRRKAAAATSTIVILPVALDDRSNREQLGLSESEDALLHLLIVISKRVGAPVFDLKQMRTACVGWDDGYLELGKFTGACGMEYARLNASRSRAWQWILAGTLAAVLGFGAMLANVIIGYGMVGLITGLPIFLVGLFCATSGAMHELTDQGQQLAGRCLGLKHYMQDFSNFTDRGTADLALWDWYMVYAAAFGISEQVMRELARAYPQVSDPRWLDDNAADSMFYWTYRPYGWGAWGDDRYGRGDSRGDGLGAGGLGAGAGAGAAGGLAGQFGATPLFGGSSYAPGFGDLGSQLSAGFADVTSTIDAAAPSSSDSGGDFDFGSGGSFSGGGFGGSSGGSGGGSFGGR